jgi:ATP-dependent DNA helicase RecQ
LTLVISPLIALMKDQVDQLAALGLPATMINSTVPRDQQRSRLEQAMSGKIKLLYIAPERFQSDEFPSGLPAVEESPETSEFTARARPHGNSHSGGS